MQNREKLKDWLTTQMVKNQWSADKWANKAGIAPSTITRFLKHDDAPMISFTTISKLLGVLPGHQVSPVELEKDADMQNNSIYTEFHDAVPRWDYKASAGEGITIQKSPEEQDVLIFQRKWLEKIASDNTDKLFALTIEGNSMSPTLLDGDTLLIDRGQRLPRADGIYLINVDGDLLVKRLQKSLVEGTWTIISDNPLYPSESGITPNLLDIEGRVVWIGRQV